MEQRQLSDKSKKFLDGLRLYLFSSGKNEKEINEIAEELEVHLLEAELHGKSIERIVGESPTEYMEMISNQMKVDYKAWAKYVPLIVIGSLSFTIIGDLLQGMLSYSLLKIIGTILCSITFLGGVFMTFRYVTKNQVSRTAEFLILLLPILLNMLLLGGVLVADSIYETPTINFDLLGSMIIGLLTLSFVVGFSIWAKTAVIPIVLIALHLPEFALSFTSLEKESQLITGMVLTYLFIGLYLFFTLKKLKKEASHA